jgi:hypothetical protein
LFFCSGRIPQVYKTIVTRTLTQPPAHNQRPSFRGRRTTHPGEAEITRTLLRVAAPALVCTEPGSTEFMMSCNAAVAARKAFRKATCGSSFPEFRASTNFTATHARCLKLA